MSRKKPKGRGRSPRWRRNQRLKCGCMGYHFPHRKGGGACEHSRTHIYWKCRQQGMDHMEAMIEQIWENPAATAVVGGECPF